MRITHCVGDMACAQGAELAFAHAKNAGNLAQEIILAIVIAAIGHGDMEQPLHQVAEHAGVQREHPGDPAGIFVKSRHILPCEVEHAGGFGFGFGRDVEHFAKGAHFVAGDLPVSFGHFRAQRDNGDGKGDRAFRRGAQLVENRA